MSEFVNVFARASALLWDSGGKNPQVLADGVGPSLAVNFYNRPGAA
jgi:hypothetical protein